MPAPKAFLENILGRRSATATPIIADKDSAASVAIAERILDQTGLSRNIVNLGAQQLGRQFEEEVAEQLRADLPNLAPQRAWSVQRPGLAMSEFAQYAHLREVDRLIQEDETRTLAIVFGQDYSIAPDVTVGEGSNPTMLHAVVSCKATIRSDRVQNIRLEAAQLVRQRMGRLPHIVAVTSEPLPSRLASICRGTGDLDAVYHIALPQLIQAVADLPSSKSTTSQSQHLNEIIQQNRLRDFSQLAPTLAR